MNYFKTITLGLTATLARIDKESFWITLNHQRLEFLNLLKGFIIEREKIEKIDLFNAPFTVIHPLGFAVCSARLRSTKYYILLSAWRPDGINIVSVSNSRRLSGDGHEAKL